MKECQIKPYIAEVTADKLEQQRLNSIHNEVFRRLSSSKLFNNWNGKLWEYKNKGVTAINKGRQLVGQINRDYGQVVVRSGQPVRVDVRPLLNPNTITTQQNVLSKSDKIIFGHPGIGKSFARESNNNIIDFDTDYKTQINQKYGLEDGFKALNSWRVNNDELYKQNIRNLWKDAIKESKNTGKILLASDMTLLREFPSDFDKVINISKGIFVSRAKQRNDYTQGETESWKDNIDKAIRNISSEKVITTDKYLSELLPVESSSLITIRQGNQFVSEGEVYPTYEDAVVSEDVIADIYSEIGLNKNALINQEYINEVQTKLDEYNSLNTGKELSLREVGSLDKYLIQESYKYSYLSKVDNSVIENISEEYSPTTSNSNFSCL